MPNFKVDVTELGIYKTNVSKTFDHFPNKDEIDQMIKPYLSEKDWQASKDWKASTRLVGEKKVGIMYSGYNRVGRISVERVD